MEIRQDHERIAQELESSKQDEKELESFIETKQSELDEWKEEEGKVSKGLEEIRLQSSTLDQKEKFDQENLSRLRSEVKALQTEKDESMSLLLIAVKRWKRSSRYYTA